ncbi:hypothetical protein GCM10025876_15860 [Demequina litorisediminis]|uniref:PurM-like C-terminal domain-containing protein n=1 Tax=Demequina litorisediminis TaxID=1849022 RepID=A0ABQ6IC37_9MICO|nr:hypothetical protein GCM10025876_15860 [Demequina litorisediminis]
MHVWLDDVLLRDPTLNAGEILMSESQERMMAVVTPEKLDEFMAITAKWDVESSVVGEVNDSGRLTIDHHGQRIVDVDPRTVAHEGPTYDRPYARPAWMDALQADAFAAELPATGDDLRKAVVDLMASPNLADRSWITNQYDRYVQGNTASARPDTVGVVRVDEETGRGVAIATRSNDRYTKAQPLRRCPPVRGRCLPRGRHRGRDAHRHHRRPELRLARGPRCDVAVRGGHPRPRGRVPGSRRARHGRQRVALQRHR